METAKKSAEIDSKSYFEPTGNEILDSKKRDLEKKMKSTGLFSNMVILEHLAKCKTLYLKFWENVEELVFRIPTEDTVMVCSDEKCLHTENSIQWRVFVANALTGSPVMDDCKIAAVKNLLLEIVILRSFETVPRCRLCDKPMNTVHVSGQDCEKLFSLIMRAADIKVSTRQLNAVVTALKNGAEISNMIPIIANAVK